jgi:hypothetical protein
VRETQRALSGPAPARYPVHAWGAAVKIIRALFGSVVGFILGAMAAALLGIGLYIVLYLIILLASFLFGFSIAPFEAFVRTHADALNRAGTVLAWIGALIGAALGFLRPFGPARR